MARRHICLLAVGLLLLNLSACGGKNAQPDETAQGVKTVTVTLVGEDYEKAKMRYYLSLADAAEEEYQYKVISGYNPYNSQDLTVLNTELLSGSGADLILFTWGVDTATEHFENLAPFLNQSERLSRDGFLPNLLDSLVVNGELHELWTGVSVYTAMSDCEELAGSFGLPPRTLMELVEDGEEYCYLFEPWLTADELWKWGASIAACTFVDYENFTCSFDDPSFLELLSMCAAAPESFDPLDYRENEAMLRLFGLARVKDACNWLHEYGNRMRLVGLPCVGSFYRMSGFSMAIPKTSENKNGAWRFFERQLSEETQVKQYGEGDSPPPGIPVTIAAFEKILILDRADTKSEEMFRELLDRTCHAETVRSEVVRSMLLQEGYAYLNGAVSSEDFADRIQARISLFLSEHKW